VAGENRVGEPGEIPEAGLRHREGYGAGGLDIFRGRLDGIIAIAGGSGPDPGRPDGMFANGGHGPAVSEKGVVGGRDE
jgi:hypothetical protein